MTTMLKLSGLPSEAKKGWTTETLRPYAEHIIDCFGPSRSAPVKFGVIGVTASLRSGLNTVSLGRFSNHFCERYRNADDGEKRLI